MGFKDMIGGLLMLLAVFAALLAKFTWLAFMWLWKLA